MRKILAFLVLLMLPWAARGQALADWYYWFDMEEAPHESGSVTNQQFQIPVDVSHLDWGLHTLYVQVKDTTGVYSTPHGEVFYNIPANGQKLSNFCYWFDGDIEVKELPYNQGSYQIDITGLNPGFHFINYYVKDELGGMTGFKSSGFYRVPMLSRQKLNYWFSGDATAISVADYRDGFIIDVTRLLEGFNTIYFQMEDNGPTDIQSYNFIKVPQTENAGDMTLVCIIDGKVVGEEKVAAHGGVVKCDMDVSDIEVGMHKAMFQLISPSGAGSSIAETYFIRTLTKDDIASMQCSYTIDGMHNRVHKGTCTNGVFHFDLPVAEVEDGLHRIDFMLVAENGATTTQGNAWFFKTPVGGNGITQYDYWLNNKSDEVHSVTLDEPKDPFQLIKLLPVTSEPIRSSCFHFELKDGKPMMYAKNDIHFRFHDKSGRWVDEDKQYVDYNTSATVADIAELKSTQTFERPDSNCVTWFSFEAAPGDTIGFKSSQATSLQVFAPSGKEVFSASGDKSVKYNGAHTWEDGTYYVAVHDVTGSKPNITLDYFHMDRYDVVDQDVRVVGNGGCSTITFQGNGFGDLYAVDLYTAQGDTIHSIDVGHESDAETTVTFDFTGAELGRYNALFHFTEGKKVIVNCMTVEEAKDIELAMDVMYPSTYLRGTSTTYTVKVTNKGNMTAYGVPVELRLITNLFEDVETISFGGSLKSVMMPDILNDDSLDVEEKMLLKEIVNSIDDKSQFLVVRDSIHQTDYGFSHLLATIAPNSTQVYTITIRSNSRVDLRAITTKDWLAVSTVEYKSQKRLAKSSGSLCCMKEQYKCAAEAMATLAGMVSTAIPGVAGGHLNCAASVLNSTVSLSFDIGCSGEGSAIEKIRSYAKSHAASLANTLISTGVNCIMGYFGPLVKSLREDWRIAVNIGNKTVAASLLSRINTYRSAMNNSLLNLYKNVNSGVAKVNCLTLAADPIPGCPPNPDDGGGPSDPVNSLDPNDIYGYLAESGSKFMADSIVTVPYRIEFENDTTFATASAHTVVVTDTLDANRFDLTTYQPTSIKIGDKDVQLKGDKEFVTTVDMRPEINAIAQVEGMYDEKKGIATWMFTSLDPMTMEPTDDVMQGFLPINFDGNGIGEVAFNIDLKPGMSDGMQIDNRASIVFDNNDAIMTPVWTNTIDAVAPTSHVSGTEMLASDSVRIHFEGADERSGVWKYTLYAQYGEGTSWEKVAETDTTCVDFKFYDDMDYGFCVLATDSAGNVEQKELVREYGLQSFLKGDANSDGVVDVKDAILIINHYVPVEGTYLNMNAADANGDGAVDVKDAIWVIDHYVHDVNHVKAFNSILKRTKIKVL